MEGKAGCELLGDLPWGETSLARVGTSQVEVELVVGDLGQELGAAGEALKNSSSMGRAREPGEEGCLLTSVLLTIELFGITVTCTGRASECPP